MSEEKMMAGSTLYTKEHRLAEVMALIQVLGLNADAHRSEGGLRTDLKGGPKSTESWTEVAEAHPEFFRVSHEAEHGVSLVARHAMPKARSGRAELTGEFTHQLLRSAIDLHDRETRRKERWKHLVPLASAFVIGISAFVGSILGAFIGAK